MKSFIFFIFLEYGSCYGLRGGNGAHWGQGVGGEGGEVGLGFPFIGLNGY